MLLFKPEENINHLEHKLKWLVFIQIYPFKKIKKNSCLI